MLELVKSFSEVIEMEFGIEKCVVLHVRRRKVINSLDITLMDGINIKALNGNDTYNYLGIDKGLQIKGRINKERIKEEMYRIIKIIQKLKTSLKL